MSIDRLTRLLAVANLAILLAPSASFAQEAMALAEQNALIQKHCTVCHDDAARNGGLSLVGFSADRAPDSLMAMLLSKMTQGLSVRTLQASHADPEARMLVATRMKGGAMMAAGIAPPSDTTMYALIEAIAGRIANALEWQVGVEPLADGSQTVTASILREAPRGSDGEAAMYRLIATCNVGKREGELRLSWSPVPAEGTLLVSVDGSAAAAYRVEGMEKMGNGLPGLTPPASVVLIDRTQRAIVFPERSLQFSGLLGDDVTFPMASLPGQTRLAMAPCFR